MWLEENMEEILPGLAWLNEPSDLPCEMENAYEISLTFTEMANVIKRYPEAARDRSTLKKIECGPPAWYGINSTLHDLTITCRVGGAMSVLHIVSGLTTHSNKGDPNHESLITLYQLKGIHPSVQKVLHVQSLLREYARTFLTPLWFKPGKYTIRLPDHTYTDGPKVVMEFAERMQKHSPMSYYSCGYHPLPKVERKDYYTSVEAELCENFVAYILGFTFCEDHVRSWNPFIDRPDIKKIVENLLHAELA